MQKGSVTLGLKLSLVKFCSSAVNHYDGKKIDRLTYWIFNNGCILGHPYAPAFYVRRGEGEVGYAH